MELPEQVEGVRYYEGIGRRKRSSARVRIYPEAKEDVVFVVNGKDVHDYFPRFGDYKILAGPLADVAVGTDTGGSVREPASQCGVVGIAPSPGLVPMAGVVPFDPACDRVGPLAADTALVA